MMLSIWNVWFKEPVGHGIECTVVKLRKEIWAREKRPGSCWHKSSV